MKWLCEFEWRTVAFRDRVPVRWRVARPIVCRRWGLRWPSPARGCAAAVSSTRSRCRWWSTTWVRRRGSFSSWSARPSRVPNARSAFCICPVLFSCRWPVPAGRRSWSPPASFRWSSSFRWCPSRPNSHRPNCHFGEPYLIIIERKKFSFQVWMVNYPNLHNLHENWEK